MSDHSNSTTSPGKKVGRPARTEDVYRVGIYLTPEQFTNAKAAYLGDWNNGGSADTFSKWIESVISTHANRSLKQRQEYATTRAPRSETRTGSSRSFNISTNAERKMREAINLEHAAGRYLSDSSWCGEAIDAAIAVALERNHGMLPTPPERLPNRLKR